MQITNWHVCLGFHVSSAVTNTIISNYWWAWDLNRRSLAIHQKPTKWPKDSCTYRQENSVSSNEIPTLKSQVKNELIVQMCSGHQRVISPSWGQTRQETHHESNYLISNHSKSKDHQTAHKLWNISNEKRQHSIFHENQVHRLLSHKAVQGLLRHWSQSSWIWSWIWSHINLSVEEIPFSFFLSIHI